LFNENFKAIVTQLSSKHGFALTDGDRDGLRFVYRSWFEGGPSLRYQLTTGPGARGGRGGGGFGGFGRGMPSYAELMTADDGAGKNRAYLADEATFTWLKDLETRNMLVPVVGNFAGPKGLRSVGAWLKQYGQTVSAFYLSDVEMYLRQDGIWKTFCANAATLPIDAKSAFIRSNPGGGNFVLDVNHMAPEVANCGR